MLDDKEISIKELILILLKEIKLIAIITFLFTIIAIFVTLSLPKIYQTQSQITFNLPSENISRFGTYSFPSQNIADYLPLLSSEEVKNDVATELNIVPSSMNVIVDFNKENKFVIVKTRASTPELAKKINDVLVDTYIKRIRTQYKIEAINKFINLELNNIKNRSYQIETIQSLIEEKQILLDEIEPVYILMKAIFSDTETAALYASKYNLDFSKLSNDVILEEYANEKYLEIRSEIIDLKLELINHSENKKFSEKLILELNKEKGKTVELLQTSNYEAILNDELDVLNNSIVQVGSAVVPESRISPKNSINVAIGFVTGLIFSVIFVFLKYYWKSEIELKK